ncbi:MAG TPA: RNA methyltransferase [Longimicrobiaceae bacterium]|nr:RNA methyltransferase [Longimicrobiaceae bacterium]
MLTRRESRLLRGLHQRKNREAEGAFLVEGVRAVEDLLASPLHPRLLAWSSSLEDTGRGRALLAAAGRRGVPLREVSEAELREYAGTETPQGVVAVAEVPVRGLDDLAAASPPTVVLVLDAVQDPGNFGAMVRTAEALGAVGVVALPGTVDAWNPKSVRAAMGSSFRLPIVAATWEEAGPRLEAGGFRILATAVGAEPLGDDRPQRAALVMGNEGAGVSAETRARAHREVGIPLRGRAESLNVTSAAAILLHDLLR